MAVFQRNKLSPYHVHYFLITIGGCCAHLGEIKIEENDRVQCTCMHGTATTFIQRKITLPIGSCF